MCQARSVMAKVMHSLKVSYRINTCQVAFFILSLDHSVVPGLDKSSGSLFSQGRHMRGQGSLANLAKRTRAQLLHPVFPEVSAVRVARVFVSIFSQFSSRNFLFRGLRSTTEVELHSLAVRSHTIPAFDYESPRQIFFHLFALGNVHGLAQCWS